MKREQIYLSTVDPRAGELARELGLGVEIAEYCTAWNMDREYPQTDERLRGALAGNPRRILHGPFIEQCERHCPEVIDSFRALAKTGCVEFLSETYYHSLASLTSATEFKHQVLKHKALIEETFGVTPVTFRNTELIYSDAIGAAVYEMGFKTMLTEGAKHVMGSPT